MKRTIRFLSLLVVVGCILLSEVGNGAQVAHASATLPTLNMSQIEVGTLKIAVLGKDWRYSDKDPSGFEFFISKLSNVEFTIYKNGKEYAKQRTNSDGEMNIQLPVGSYTFTQTTAYPNYPKYPPHKEHMFATFFPDKREFTVHIKKEKIADYIVYNEPISSEIYGINPW
ncbi:hypothetical protein CN345_23605 [Bacillus thuringiensis]|uniref:SpaA isopeptide-forming pilin-related protein n=1 Tax=Bacillus thuringiensis TaxID=1428 RepID=UPI000BF87492|nr:prealbumin-like fold domain-containing protein [Bacillus thuringiensis]PEZ27227.1 hypothetical protein CN345_23605 [Bacillus thuringiensis]PGY42878.1 hypothetical protein COE09_25075 [Bacillus thuringiensis]